MDGSVRACVCVIQHDAVSNLRKAKSLYVSRQQELDKLKSTAKAETESLSLAVSVAGNAGVVRAETKTERKKKQEDDALQKVYTALSRLLLLCGFQLLSNKPGDLPMWPSGQSTRVPCAVERNVTCSVAAVQTSARAHPPTKELFLIIPTYMMNREIIPGRKKMV